MMNIRIFIAMIMISTTIQTRAQENSLCDNLRNELHQAVESFILSEIDYRYYKLLSACEVTMMDMGMVAGAFESKGYTLTWNADKTYKLNSIPQDSIDFQKYYGNTTFENINPNHPIRKKHNDIHSFYQSINKDIEDLPQYPTILLEHNLIHVCDYDKDILLDLKTYKPLITYQRKTGELNYQGNGLFMVNEQEKCIVYQVTNRSNKTTVKKIIEQSGNGFVVPITTTKSYIAVQDFLSDKVQSYLYDQNGKIILAKYDQIEFSPLSRTLILRKDTIYTLKDYTLKDLVTNADYIIEVWHQDRPCYVVDRKDGTRDLIDRSGNKIVDGQQYKELFISQTPYALVQKGQQTGLIDIITKEPMIPFQNGTIKQLIPGYWTYVVNNKCRIVDEQNRVFSEIEASEISILDHKSKALLLIKNKDNRKGVMDLFGNIIIPTQYDGIQMDTNGKSLVLYQGQTSIKADMNGKKL